MKNRMWMLAAVCLLTMLSVWMATRALAIAAPADPPASDKTDAPAGKFDRSIDKSADTMLKEGRQTFRYDTFGDEAFWGDQLQLHRALIGQSLGGVGAGLTPRQALALGLKVDEAKLPPPLRAAIKGGTANLDQAATTVDLLRADAVVGVKGFFDKSGKMTSVGITCALCHSTVDNALASGMGQRLDGWPNRDLNVGAIIALAPNLKPLTDVLGVDEATLKAVLASWGPGKYDAELIQDGKALRPDGKPAATLLPAAFGLAGVNLHTYTGWGSVSYWNAYVAITQMHGDGTFFDPRLNNPEQYPIAAKTGAWNTRPRGTDRVTPKLAALQFYQLAIPAPTPDENSYDHAGSNRGEALFNGKAQCAGCHVPPLFTEPGWAMHRAEEIGIDDFQASRSPDKHFYRTTPLKGLFTRMKGGFYHDGRFKDLPAVVAHYESVLKLQLTAQESADLVEYLKSL